MLGLMSTRRNLVFRVSIVINVAVLLYAAMHFSGNGSQPGEWAPLTVVGGERSPDFRYVNRDELRNETETAPLDSSVRVFEESTSQKTPPTAPAANKTASSTTSAVDLLNRKVNAPVPSETEAVDETDAVDENVLSDATLVRLRNLIECNEKDFLPETLQRGEYWVLKNFVRAEHGNILCHETITYTTHAGFEFLDNVLPLVERWMAPVSLAIHAPGTDFAATMNSIRYLRDCSGSSLIRQLVTFHVFFPHKHVPSNITEQEGLLVTPYNCTESPPYVVKESSTYKKSKDLLYPVNVARNIAREAAQTHFLLPSDIELYPSPNLVPRFLNMIARNGKPLNTSTNPRVFPISIFEVDAKVNVPSTKRELQAMLANKTAIPFHKYVCSTCHSIPQGQQWMKAAETNQMDVFHVGKRRGQFLHWEPIFIGTNQEPYYDERLSWEGKKDKMTQGYVLCVKDYDFMILNDAFLIHKPGIKRYVKDAKRDSITYRQNVYVKTIIMPELQKLYGTRSGCSL